MAKYSYTKVALFDQCPRRYKYKYIDKLPEPYNEIFTVGKAVHKGLEAKSVDVAIKYLKENVPVYNDQWVDEETKIKAVLPQAIDGINKFSDSKHEIKLDSEEFIGFIDMIANDDIYDFKYTKSGAYLDGRQLNVYKHFCKKILGKDTKDMYYVIIPKVAIKKKKDESLGQYRARLDKELEGLQVKKIKVKEDPQAVKWFFDTIKKIEGEKKWEKQENDLCFWCPYKTTCKGEGDKMEEKKQQPEQATAKPVQAQPRKVVPKGMMELPKAERCPKVEKKLIKLWIYGKPYSGKSTFANQADMPLVLNTDGNAGNLDAPFIPLKDENYMLGNIPKKKWGWETFKNAIATLEADAQGFKTVVVDLVEGTYELCRSYMYKEHGWTHEGDDPFKAWDMIRKEFLDVLRRITNLPLNVILISHEGEIKDITARSGSQMSTFKPNIQEKVANQLAGMVDVVARLVTKDEKHYLTFKHDETVFGGGRIKMAADYIELDANTDFKKFKEICGIEPKKGE